MTKIVSQCRVTGVVVKWKTAKSSIKQNNFIHWTILYEMHIVYNRFSFSLGERMKIIATKLRINKVQILVFSKNFVCEISTKVFQFTIFYFSQRLSGCGSKAATHIICGTSHALLGAPKTMRKIWIKCTSKILWNWVCFPT